jgi:hypothetical protein
VVLFGWRVPSARLHVEHMDNEQEQKKERKKEKKRYLFCQYFVQLLRIPGNGIVEYKS